MLPNLNHLKPLRFKNLRIFFVSGNVFLDFGKPIRSLSFWLYKASGALVPKTAMKKNYRLCLCKQNIRISFEFRVHYVLYFMPLKIIVYLPFLCSPFTPDSRHAVASLPFSQVICHFPKNIRINLYNLLKTSCL